MSDFVHDDRFQSHVRSRTANDRYVGILHAPAGTDGPVHGSDLLVRVITVPLRIVARRIGDVLGCFAPQLRFGRRKHGPSSDYTARPWQLGASLEYPPPLVGKPCKVMHIVLPVAQRFRLSGRHWKGIDTIGIQLQIVKFRGVDSARSREGD